MRVPIPTFVLVENQANPGLLQARIFIRHLQRLALIIEGAASKTRGLE